MREDGDERGVASLTFRVMYTTENSHLYIECTLLLTNPQCKIACWRGHNWYTQAVH